MTRSSPYTFIDLHNDNEKESNKSFCRKCKEYIGKLHKLVPRYTNGILDDKFMICEYCAEIYPIYDIPLELEYEPKAQTVENPFESGTKIVAIERKRKYKQKKHSRVIDNDQDIPPFMGAEDKDLKAIIGDRPAIINYISDDEPMGD